MSNSTNSFAYLMSRVNENCKIEICESFQSLKEGTKTVFVEDAKEIRNIEREEYARYIDAAPFFRSLGGSETITSSYTCTGYVPVRLVSKSPNRDTKIVREFKFTYEPEVF